MSMKDEWEFTQHPPFLPEDVSKLQSVQKPLFDKHYKTETLEVWDIIPILGLSWLSGNVLKYLARHRHKDGEKDLLKALDYLLKEVKTQYGTGREVVDRYVEKHYGVQE